jgi:hypothetical protein
MNSTGKSRVLNVIRIPLVALVARNRKIQSLKVKTAEFHSFEFCTSSFTFPDGIFLHYQYPRGVKMICYFAGLNGYMKEPKVLAGLSDATSRGQFNDTSLPSDECRKRRLTILKEYADRYKDKIAGWWFDGIGLDTYQAQPDDWRRIESVVHAANPKAIIAFNYGANEQACLCKGVDDYTGGDTWSKQYLKQLTPQRLPSQEGILWHGKIYCGNVYHGQGDDTQFSDQELIEWINTCNRQGGVCTLDWPFDPQTGLLKNFGLAQLKRIALVVKADEQVPQRHAYEPTWESLDQRPVGPWWLDAKFGIYVHWTLASVPGWGNHSSFYWPNSLKSRQMEANGPRPAKNAVVEVGLTMEVPPLSVDKLPCEHTHTIKLA